jgi:hypothetical protein
MTVCRQKNFLGVCGRPRREGIRGKNAAFEEVDLAVKLEQFGLKMLIAETQHP